MTDWQKTDTGWRISYSPASTPAAASDFPCPRVMSDTMPDTIHIDGKHYSSKSEFRAVTKANGCIEVGNDASRLRPMKAVKGDDGERRQAVSKAIAQTLGT